MAVQVWIGEKPEHPNERRAIMALANGLDRLDGLYLILANFSVGGRSIDLVIAKQDAVFIIELKHCDGKVFGEVNGPCFVESANGPLNCGSVASPVVCKVNTHFGKNLGSSFEDLDIFQIGGVIFF